MAPLLGEVFCGGMRMPMLIGQGLELLIYGMGTVVVFLTVLVFATRFMSWVVQTYFPTVDDASPAAARSNPSRPPSPTPVPGSPSPAQLAAITAALHLHRNRT